MNLFNGRLVHTNPALIAAHALFEQGHELNTKVVSDAAEYCEQVVEFTNGSSIKLSEDHDRITGSALFDGLSDNEAVPLREGVVSQYVDTRFREGNRPSFFGNAGSGQASFNERIHFSGFVRDLGK